MTKLLAIAAIAAAISSPAIAAQKSFWLANMPFTCDTDSDCEFKTAQFGCKIVDDVRAGDARDSFLCTDPTKFARALKEWNRKHPHDTRD